MRKLLSILPVVAIAPLTMVSCSKQAPENLETEQGNPNQPNYGASNEVDVENLYNMIVDGTSGDDVTKSSAWFNDQDGGFLTFTYMSYGMKINKLTGTKTIIIDWLNHNINTWIDRPKFKVEGLKEHKYIDVPVININNK